MSNIEKQAAFAQMTQAIHERRQATHAAETQSLPPVTAEQHEMKNSELFRQSFGHKKITEPAARVEHPKENTWDRALRLAVTDDDAPRPPETTDVPALPVVLTPPEETRARQTGLSAADLFQAMEQRLTVTPEATPVPPEVAARRAYRELPGADRERLAAIIQEQDYGMPGYFDGRNLPEDYRAFLVGSALAKRLQDARRLQPELSPSDLLRAMLGQG
jgi:hypothetical protein